MFFIGPKDWDLMEMEFSAPPAPGKVVQSHLGATLPAQDMFFPNDWSVSSVSVMKQCKIELWCRASSLWTTQVPNKPSAQTENAATMGFANAVPPVQPDMAEVERTQK